MDISKTRSNTAATVAGSQAHGADAAGVRAADKKIAKKNEATVSKAASSSVQLSDRAQMMSKAKDIARNTEVNNDAKVARLQKLIDEGKYKVDAEAVADRLVDSHMEYPE